MYISLFLMLNVNNNNNKIIGLLKIIIFLTFLLKISYFIIKNKIILKF